MGIKVSLHHKTQYRYDKAVSLGPQVIQLRPTPHSRTRILSYSLDVTPADRILNWSFDPHANHLARVLFPSRTTEFSVEVNLVADLTPINPFAFFLEPGYDTFPFTYAPELAKDLEPYRLGGPFNAMGPLLKAFLYSISLEPQGTVAFLAGLNQKIAQEISYGMRMEHGIQSCEETLELRSGSCRDSAWLLVEVCRRLGIAARFVSGYLIQLVPEDRPLDGPAGPTEDSAALHAWAEVFLPGAGWIGLDPTSGMFAAEGHIPLTCTPSAAQAAPIGGTVEKAEVVFTYDLTIRRLSHESSLAKPFSDAQWAKVREVAHTIDRDLQAQDVRMTMGGEPTYVGIEEPESPQWNLEASGGLKRTIGLALIRRLRARTAPGALLLFGQGKWYPGEALPRWAFHCISRIDGVPVWEDVDLIAQEGAEYGLADADALRFMHALTRRLQVTADNVLPVFNPAEEYEEAYPEPAGYLLPLRRRQIDGHLVWSSQLWFPRPERFELSGGDSPIGFRVPLATIPWAAADELEYEYEAQPFADRVKLPAGPARHPEYFDVEPAPDPLPAMLGDVETAKELIRPSLCVQVRDGRLHVFLPYIPVLADFLDLVAAVEDTCRYQQVAIWVEGYAPGADPRVRPFSLTPDPGVLEVNLPPTSNWDELESINEILAEEAHANRLTAGKFALDGTLLATGGGSHIVLGGATVMDSPVLRRPDLLRSMVAFWQNHPSLSYFFSGMYVGPTSQYPRVDEARVDALYELEVSFARLPATNCPAWILDALFRNLLADSTGNTHRAEFCLDKLYPPDGAGLKLGLVEMRAFEMAPHFRMGLLQMLLIRGLVSLFWKKPFQGGLIRWGTALHDRFMLPHYVYRDFQTMLEPLLRAGYAFDEAWFAPQMEFRFPKIGSIAADGVELELRQALEPWNVLAEQSTSGGTVRSVDSSLERMQVKVTGLVIEGRYVISCNGRRVPLHPTDKQGEAVAGIRYRARQLSLTLHPTVPVHLPLTFDLIDTWRDCSIGRCTYYGGAPDGSIYTARPASAGEARERRLARFVIAELPSGTNCWPMSAPQEEINPSFPMTLDMRWPSPAEKETRTDEQA